MGRSARIRRRASGASMVLGISALESATGLQRIRRASFRERSTSRLSRENADFALLAVLLGCGLRRAELTAITVGDFDQRDGQWLLPDVLGKSGHIRTVPVPGWVKAAVDRWTRAAGIPTGPVFRAVDRTDQVWGDGIDTKVIWTIVRRRAQACGLEHVAPHDLRRTCARLCHEPGGELEQIQFLLGHVSIKTTERYLGCKAMLRSGFSTPMEVYGR